MQEYCSDGNRQGAPSARAQGVHRPHPLAPTISPGSPAQSMSSRVSLLCRALAGLVWPSSMGSSMSHMVCITSARGQRRIRWRISSTVPQSGGQL